MNTDKNNITEEIEASLKASEEINDFMNSDFPDAPKKDAKLEFSEVGLRIRKTDPRAVLWSEIAHHLKAHKGITSNSEILTELLDSYHSNQMWKGVEPIDVISNIQGLNAVLDTHLKMMSHEMVGNNEMLNGLCEMITASNSLTFNIQKEMKKIRQDLDKVRNVMADITEQENREEWADLEEHYKKQQESN